MSPRTGDADCPSYPCFDDPTVSEWHLKLYSIVHDKSGKSDIEPLLYAEDLSTNGTYWNGTLIGKDNGGFLISDRDELSISPSITLTFHAEDVHERKVGDSLQKSDMGVRWPFLLFPMVLTEPYSISRIPTRSHSVSWDMVFMAKCTWQYIQGLAIK